MAASCDEGATVTIDTNAMHAQSDNALILAVLREAAADPDQPNLDEWLRELVCGFSGKAVEDAYQAGQASGRALGVVVMTLLWGLAGLFTHTLGNATTASEMLGLNFQLFSVLMVITLVPFTIKLLPEWKPAKNRNLMFLTCCALATQLLLMQFVVFLWLIDQGHAISRPDIMVWTFACLIGPVCEFALPTRNCCSQTPGLTLPPCRDADMIMLARPSALLISATCTMATVDFGALGYYTKTFDSLAVSIMAAISFHLTLHVMWLILENTSRTSFVHQLDAMHHAEAAVHHAEAATRQSEVARKRETFVQIVAATAHDMRTQVSAIQSGCRILRTDFERGANSELPGTITRMNAALETALCFLDCMLVSSQLLEGMNVMAKPEVLEVTEVVDNAILCTKLCCSSVLLDVVGTVPDGVAEFVISDRQCILRSLMNLLNNACHHTRSGSIVLSVSVWGTGTRYLKFAVTDTGTGHDPNDTALWDPFVSTRKETSLGTGMGLFVIKRQAEALGGSCGSSLNPAGSGSVFWFQVPYVPTIPPKPRGINENDYARGGDHYINPGGEALGASAGEEGPCVKSVLLIDDTKLVLELLALELQGQGFDVTQAYGGNAGLEALRQHEFDVCFCDFQMSGMDGCEVTRLFREWEAVNRVGKRQDIIALTAYTNKEVSDQCKDAGMQGILTKPLNMALALDMIGTLQRKAGGRRGGTEATTCT